MKLSTHHLTRRRVRFLAHAPIAYVVGDLYFEAEFQDGSRCWVCVKRSTRRAARQWMNRILHNSQAVSVTLLYAGREAA